MSWIIYKPLFDNASSLISHKEYGDKEFWEYISSTLICGNIILMFLLMLTFCTCNFLYIDKVLKAIEIYVKKIWDIFLVLNLTLSELYIN